MKKKICFVVSSPFTAEAFLMHHIETLAVYYDIYLAANFGDKTEDFGDDISLKGIKHIAIPRKIILLKDLAALFELRSYFKKEKFDAVHTITPKAGLLGIIASRLSGVKIRIHIFTGQVWHTKQGVFKFLLMLLDRLIVWNATHILVDGESQRKFLIKNKIIRRTHSWVLGKGSISGVDPNRFAFSDSVRIATRNQLGLKPTDIVFVFLGRFTKDKGLIDLANAFKRLLIENKHAKLLLVGDDEGKLEEQIRQIIDDDNSVSFIGPTNTPQDFLQVADIFCLPSYREGFGTSVIEASLMKLPIICSTTYGLLETIVENETGLFHEVGNVDAIYNQMKILINDPNLRKILGENGVNYVKQHFLAETISKEWVSFYKKIML